jgi:ribosome maturation factor RimP
MATTDVVERVTQIAERIARSEGMEVVEVEWKGGSQNRLLRIYIDKPGGVSHADCETISQQVGTILDVEDVIPVQYTLEVSSPGLDRKLLKPADYQRFLGRKVKVKLGSPVAGRSHFIGRLVEFEAGQVTLELERRERVQFPVDAVAAARLVVEL